MIQAWIAVFGSVDSTRTALAIKNPDSARAAAYCIGSALAERSCGIMVYSGDPNFIESDVVSGFAASDKAQTESIRVIYARKSPQPLFKEQQLKPSCFKFRIDSNPNWEVSFYRSLDRADGVVLVGGGQSTFVGGILAAIRSTPTAALEAYGGAASSVWELLTPSEGIITEDEKNLMAEETTSEEWAGRIVDSLLSQKTRKLSAWRKQDDIQQARRRSLFLEAMAAVILLCSGLTLFVLTWDADVDRSRLLAAIVAAPTLAGGSASLVRNLWEQVTDAPILHRPVVLMALLGSVAGAISGLLYIVAQLTALLPGDHGKLAPIAGRLVPFALLTGFLAGFAADAFFRRIRDKEVPQVEAPVFRLPAGHP
jgi:hypothetical protein